MLYKPSYMRPYLSDIDETVSNTFSCNINADGGTTATKYNAYISDLNGNVIYSTGVQTLSTPLYNGQTLNITIPTGTGMTNGTNYIWNVSIYGANFDIWIANGIVGTGSTTTSINLGTSTLIKTGMYVKIGSESKLISDYNSTTGIATTSAFSSVPASGTDYSVYATYITSNDTYFRARSQATLTINTVTSPITAKNYTFEGTYTQTDNVSYKYFQWVLYSVVSGNYVEIETTDKITSGNVEYTFDGLTTSSTYGVKLILENQDGTDLQTSISTFTVTYTSPELSTASTAVVNCDKTAIQVSWVPIPVNAGESIGTYTILTDTPFAGAYSVELDSTSSIYWTSSNLIIPPEFTLFLNWQSATLGWSGILYEHSGVGIDLVAMSTVAPQTNNVGDRYFNTSTHLLYICNQINTWSSSGTTPSVNEIYVYNGQNYIYNGTTLVTTAYTLPTYTISYNDGIFTSQLDNMGTSTTKTVTVSTIAKKWLLQANGADKGQDYRWDDTATWNDTLYWTDRTTDYANNHWFKITGQSNALQVVTH